MSTTALTDESRPVGRVGPAALSCLLAAILFGASTPASKVLLGTIPPIFLAGLLYLGAALAVLPFARRGGSAMLRRDPTNLVRLVGAVVLGGAVAPAFLLLGLSRAPAASVALWLNLEVVATAVLAWAFFREHLGAQAWGAVGIVSLAAMLLAAPSGVGTGPAAVMVAVASLCWAVDNNLTSLIDGFTPAQYTLVKGLVAGTTNLTLGLIIEPPTHAWPSLLVALVIGAVTYGLSLVLYVAGAQQIGAARSQMLFATAPFIGGLLSWTALGEPVEPLQLLAALVMIAGVGVLLSARHAHRHAHEPMIHTHSHRHDDGHHGHAHPGLPAQVHHTHPHAHEPLTHAHPHAPDLHHRHGH
jgi:drug/metabolite transporter (DMT)-like permease